MDLPPYSVHDPHPHGPSGSAHIDPTPPPNSGRTFRRPAVHPVAPAPSHALNPNTSCQPLTATSSIPDTASREDLAKTGFISAAPYFELRSPQRSRPRNTLYHHITITPDHSPGNLPFPHPGQKWISREVDHHDWTTFLTHLFPPAAAENNNGSDELQSNGYLDMAGLSLGDSRSRDDSRPLLGGTSQNYPDGKQSRELERLRQVRIEAAKAQWNDGFFLPRGLEVLIKITNITPPAPVETQPRRGSINTLQKRPPPQAEETLLHLMVAKGKRSQVKLLLEKGGEDLEALNKRGETCLYRAVSRGDKDIVQLLLDHGADPTERPPGSDSTLHIASYQGSKAILKYLVEKSQGQLEEPNSKGETPLYVALQRRHNSCIEILLEAGANPNYRPAGKDSMLHITITNNAKSIAKLLLQRGVDVEELKGGETPLYRAISRGHTAITKLLLEHGASPTALTTQGQAPLSLAVTRGDKSIVSFLVSQDSIDIEASNSSSRETPLYTAIHRGHTSIAEQLLRKGADPSRSPEGEESMLNLAIGRGSTSLVHLLLEGGANCGETNRSGETPLFQAVSRGDTSIVSLLLGKDASPDTVNPAGESALQRAVYRSNVSIVSLLLGKGADPNFRVGNGETPLYMAVHRNSASMVSVLLNHDAKPNTRSQTGDLPLSRAIYVGSTSIVSLLLNKGADPSARAVHGDTMMDYAIRRGDKTIVQLLMNYAPEPEKVLLGPA